MDRRVYETNNCLKTVCQLTEKLYQHDKKIVILCKTPTMVESLDQMLWQYKQLSFLPHMTDIDNVDPKTQPIFITSKQDSLMAESLICCDTIPDQALPIETIIGVFSKNNPDVKAFIEKTPPDQHFFQTDDDNWKKI